jgi:antitoxin ParD1/3/4
MMSNMDKDGQSCYSWGERLGGIHVNVHLTPKLETLVHNKVKTGRYNSASEVVREALRLFEERDQIQKLQIQELRKKINKGWASLERGEGVDGEEFFRTLGREERELARKNKRA